MGEFFKGWRRKFGCVTLFVTLVFAGVWVRSLSRTDKIGFGTTQQFTHVISKKGNIAWCRTFGISPSYFPSVPKGWESVPDDDTPIWTDVYEWSGNYLEKHFSPLGYAYREFRIGETVCDTALIVPYWPIVPPLTLLSAYLLLSKQRKKTATR